MITNEDFRTLDGRATVTASDRPAMPVIGRTEREIVVRSDFGAQLTGGPAIMSLEDGPVRLTRPFIVRAARSLGEDRFALEPANDADGLMMLARAAGERPEVAAMTMPAVPQADLDSVAEAPQRRGRRLTTAAFGVLAAALSAVCVLEAYQLLFVIRPASAQVSADIITLSAPQGGRIGFVAAGQSVSAGQILMGITSRNGRDVLVESPCDCTVIGQGAAVGRVVSRGNAVLLLAPEGSVRFVEILMPTEEAVRLDSSWRYEVAFANGQTVSGTLGEQVLKPVVRPLADEDDPRAGQAILRLEVPVPQDAAHSELARVRFYRTPLQILEDLVAILPATRGSEGADV